MPDLTRRFVWTVIPSGRIDQARNMASFSVVLTPKLFAPHDTTVKAFALQSWPQRLDALSVSAVRNGTRIDVARVGRIVDDAGQSVILDSAKRLAIWRSVFPADMPVRSPSRTTYDGRQAHEFPAHEAGEAVKSAYTRTANALTNLSTDFSFTRDERWAELYAIAQDWQATATAASAVRAGLSPDALPLQRAYDFYHRPAASFSELNDADLAAPALDFHDVVARLADHPILLRALGLLIDFEIPADKLTGAAGGARELGLQLSWNADPLPAEGWSNAAQQDVLPRTAYSVNGSRFVALSPSDGQPAPQGLLPLAGVDVAGPNTNGQFEVMPFDVDGASLRMFSAAASDQGHVAASAVTTAGLPTLRSMGLALVDRTRAERHTAQIQRARSLATAADLADAALTADNLTTGYRVEIFDERTKRWHPLCQRRVRYTVGGITIGPTQGLLDEGLVHADSATTGSGSTDDLYIHQVLFRWDGWSLVLPRPDRPAEPANVAPMAGITLQLIQEPGVLPRMRFGRKYRLRARLVSLAGAGLRSAELGPAEQQSAAVTHRRFEPVLAPELAPSRRYVDHERHDHMVIRSDRDATVASYSNAHGYSPVDLRYLFPPKSSLELALQHEVVAPTAVNPVGYFDSAIGKNASPADVATQFEVAKRADNELTALPDVIVVDDEQGSNKYYVVPADHNKVKLPWLPDVAADAVGMRVAEGGRPITERGTPGATQGFLDSNGQERFIVLWKGPWPDKVPIALRVVDADNTVTTGCKASATLGGAARDQVTFTVQLGAAEQVTVDLYSASDDFHVANFGVAKWAGADESNAADPVIAAIRRGRNPLVTPLRSVTMVHAVQRPLSDPSGAFTATREMGLTSARLNAHPPAPDRDPYLKVHVPSTGRIDVTASWEDVVDIPPNRPTQMKVAANVGSYDVAHQPSKVAPPNGAFQLIRQEFGDTRRRRVAYTVDATSRFRDYFGKVLAADANACTVRGALEPVDIPSGTRPPAPKIRNIVPAFIWRKSISGSVFRSSRRGGKLRVMLERPWFVTGDEESLAVVVWPQGAGRPATVQQRHISLAGRDPIWTDGAAAPAFAAVLGAAQFGSGTATTARLAELGADVTAVSSTLNWPASFDADADCWFADVDLGPLVAMSYFPFVRLTLCRFQAKTTDLGQRLSAPVTTEPLQVFPHRDLTVTRSTTNAAVVVSDPDNLQPVRTGIHAELQTFAGDPRAAADALVGDSGWRALQAKDGALGQTLNLPIQGVGAQPLRVVVTETETHQSSGSRTVYADTIQIQ